MTDDPGSVARGVHSWLSGPAGQLALAGAAGGLVKSITLRERPIEGVGSLIVGVACSIYASPLTLVVFEPILNKIVTKPGALDNFAGFATGIAGMAVVGFILDLWRYRKGKITGDNKQ